MELDRVLQDSPTPGPRPNRWAILLGIVVLGLVGLSLLPASDLAPPSADATLPDPAVATTLVGSRQPRIAFISDETFPMFVVTGLKGFVSLTEPVSFDGRWWIIGNRPDVGAAAVLSSEDGRLWDMASEIPGEGGLSIRIDQLATVDDALIAVGSEGSFIGPTFSSVLAGNLSLWRSGDGVRWIPEMIDPGDPNLAFTDIQLAVSDRSAVLYAVVDSTAAATAAARLPNHVVSGLASARFSLRPQGTRLIATGPLDIQIAEAPMTRVSQASSTRLFRSESLTEWTEIDIQFDVSGSIVAAPDGGFLTGTGGVPWTSAYGVIWNPNPRAYSDFGYERWDDEVILGFSLVGSSHMIDFIDAEGTLSVQLPSEMVLCSIKGSNQLLAAACTTPMTSPRPVQWNGFELSSDDPNWLELRDPAISSVRQFPLQRVAGIYDAEADTISLADTRGVRETFPVEVLRQLDGDTRTARYATMLSEEGLTWSRSQIALRAGEFQLMGGVSDGFLVGIRSSEPGATFTVLAADF
ncbi:MAG: hypothetical protein ACRDWA_06720 [Acidimicrobiia bacterium]